MAHLIEFIGFLNEQVSNHGIYVWGAQGQRGSQISESWIRSREKTLENAQRAIRFWHKQVDAGYGDVLRAFDCSGLGVCFLLEKKLIPCDLNANGLRGKCRQIARSELRVGDFVFNLNAAGKATHIGYVVDDKLNVIEAQGRDYGVVKRPLANRWTAYGRPPFWTEAEIAEFLGKPFQLPSAQPTGYIFTRSLRYGCRGDDVCELKKLLLAAGFGGLTLTNKNFYSSTKNVVKAFQKAKGLKVDGVAGRETISCLGGVFES